MTQPAAHHKARALGTGAGGWGIGIGRQSRRDCITGQVLHVAGAKAEMDGRWRRGRKALWRIRLSVP